MLFKNTSTSHVLKNILFNKKEPISIVHFVTNRCNARCSFCFIDFKNPETFAGELSIEEIEKLTKNLGKSLLNVNITGGEPFARKDLIDIAKKYLINSSIQSIYITTNASLPNRIKKFAEEISNFRNDVELTFQISIDDFPAQHDKVRKIKGLFSNCVETYKLLKRMGNKINPIVSITVTHENCDRIKEIFNYLHHECEIDSIKCTIVRDEGVFKTPYEKKKKIYEAYDWLTNEIKNKIKSSKIKNYNTNSIQGKIHQKKDIISWEMIKKMYMNPKYISPCHAGSLFGIITSNGKVYPCEILENKLLGDLRDNDMDFMKIWKNKNTNDARKKIIKEKCNCTYECALSYNILGNWRYQAHLASSLFNLN
jgi:radical SAM protein with 4Fe4S-binding SPASM domain